MAVPPELPAVTVTFSPDSGSAVSMETTPVAASIVAPLPSTAKRKDSPLNAKAVGISCGPLSSSKTSSGSSPTTIGASIGDRERRGLGGGAAGRIGRRHPAGERRAVVLGPRSVGNCGGSGNLGAVPAPGEGERRRRVAAPDAGRERDSAADRACAGQRRRREQRGCRERLSRHRQAIARRGLAVRVGSGHDDLDAIMQRGRVNAERAGDGIDVDAGARDAEGQGGAGETGGSVQNLHSCIFDEGGVQRPRRRRRGGADDERKGFGGGRARRVAGQDPTAQQLPGLTGGRREPRSGRAGEVDAVEAPLQRERRIGRAAPVPRIDRDRRADLASAREDRSPDHRRPTHPAQPADGRSDQGPERQAHHVTRAQPGHWRWCRSP